ncbi:MAG: hypothetical protein ACE5JX_13500, partial [Acidobacteriota bacterium]
MPGLSNPTGKPVLEYSLGDAQSHLWVLSRQAIEAYALPPRPVIEQATLGAVIIRADCVAHPRPPRR